MRKLSFITLALLSILKLNAQDLRFSQYYSNPLYLNPALAGMARANRAILIHRQQGSSLNGFSTSAFALDGTLGTSSGWGVQLMRDTQMNGIIAHTQLSNVLAHRIQLSNSGELGMGVSIDYFQKRLDFERLTFEDQLDQRDGIVSNTNDNIQVSRVSGADVSVGVIYSSTNFYVGSRISHINRPKENFDIETESRLPIRYTVHAGGFLKTNNFRKAQYLLSPNIIYERQGEFNYLHLGMYLTSEFLTLGAWYVIDNSVIGSIGFNISKFRFGYSYDMPVGPTLNNLNNAHEVSASYQFNIRTNKKVKNRYKGKCPTFQRYLF